MVVQLITIEDHFIDRRCLFRRARRLTDLAHVDRTRMRCTETLGGFLCHMRYYLSCFIGFFHGWSID